jgi:hypothetical protein
VAMRQFSIYNQVWGLKASLFLQEIQSSLEVPSQLVPRTVTLVERT